MDLYQEGSIAATVAVREYTSRGGPPEGLRPYVERVVGTFLDDVVTRQEAQRLADQLLVENVKLLEAAELTLRSRLEREPTTLELAAVLNWTPQAVELVADSLALARQSSDAEILPYLDDADDDGGDGTATE
jgi:DNA-directed RNA polymerase specialized sigma subunit